MAKVYENILELIGHTPMVKLSRIKGDLKANILAKLEFYNPTGSVKDRIALSMIEEAEKQGILKKGDCIVEPTSGNTGTSLALVCALKGYRMIAVMPGEMSQERKDMMTACRLARVEGIFCGYSSGANVFASLQVAEELGAGKTIVTVIPDTGMKYLSTELFRRSPEICSIHCCTLKSDEAREECLRAQGAASCCVLEPC